MAYDFDLYVIGAGSGGVRAARFAAGFGAKVAVAQAGETSVAQASDVDWLQKTDALPAKDHCAELREKFRNPPAPRADAGRVD